ncbi:MAG: sigma-54-dependent transcriptional regulator [Planctomycetota bacterium]
MASDSDNRTDDPQTGSGNGGDEDAPGRVIVVDDEEHIRRVLRIVLEEAGYEVFTTDDGREVLKKVGQEDWDVIIQDVKMPKMDGLALLRELQQSSDPPFSLVMTAYSTWDDAVEAMRVGAHDYIKKPFDNDDLCAAVARAVQKKRLLRELSVEGTAERYRFSDILGNSPGMQELFRLIPRAAPTDSTILVTGESGTGKELVARAIHYGSRRAQGPFIPVNCGAFTESLLESELFGHVRGAFTGAVTDRKGLVEIASGGTFFLDEVAEMTPATQVKLLRVLESREFKPVGGVATRSSDVRFITATNQDLEKAVEEGRFREDLYYRLNVIPIHLPPLRERSEDIPLLAGHFLARYSERMRKRVEGIDEDAMALLISYDWPGNVRELENTIERAIALIEGDRISANDLAGPILRRVPPSGPPAPSQLDIEKGVDFEGYLEQVERACVAKALAATGGNLTRAAELLNIPFRSIRYRVKKLGIERP